MGQPTSPRPQSIQLASTSSPPDAELAVPSVVPDSHHAAHSKKDVNSNVLSSRVLWVLKVTLRVTISHSTATAHTLPSQTVCPWKRKKNSAPTVTSSKNQTPPSSSHLVAVATGQTPVVSSTTKPKTSSSGSMKKIK